MSKKNYGIFFQKALNQDKALQFNQLGDQRRLCH